MTHLLVDVITASWLRKLIELTESTKSFHSNIDGTI